MVMPDVCPSCKRIVPESATGRVAQGVRTFFCNDECWLAFRKRVNAHKTTDGQSMPVSIINLLCFWRKRWSGTLSMWPAPTAGRRWKPPMSAFGLTGWWRWKVAVKTATTSRTFVSQWKRYLRIVATWTIRKTWTSTWKTSVRKDGRTRRSQCSSSATSAERKYVRWKKGAKLRRFMIFAQSATKWWATNSRSSFVSVSFDCSWKSNETSPQKKGQGGKRKKLAAL